MASSGRFASIIQRLTAEGERNVIANRNWAMQHVMIAFEEAKPQFKKFAPDFKLEMHVMVNIADSIIADLSEDEVSSDRGNRGRLVRAHAHLLVGHVFAFTTCVNVREGVDIDDLNTLTDDQFEAIVDDIWNTLGPDQVVREMLGDAELVGMTKRGCIAALMATSFGGSVVHIAGGQSSGDSGGGGAGGGGETVRDMSGFSFGYPVAGVIGDGG